MKLKNKLEFIEKQLSTDKKEAMLTMLSADGSIAMQYKIDGPQNIVIQFIDPDLLS